MKVMIVGNWYGKLKIPSIDQRETRGVNPDILILSLPINSKKILLEIVFPILMCENVLVYNVNHVDRNLERIFLNDVVNLLNGQKMFIEEIYGAPIFIIECENITYESLNEKMIKK